MLELIETDVRFVIFQPIYDPGKCVEDVLGAEGDAGVEDGPRVLEPLLQRGHTRVELVHGDAGLPGEQAHDGACLQEPQYQVEDLVFLSHVENVYKV